MKLTFLGATHEVTGSCTLLEWLPGRFCLIDYGMTQGEDEIVNEDLPIAPSRIEYVLLTHAHIDHSGNLPLLYKKRLSRGHIYHCGNPEPLYHHAGGQRAYSGIRGKIPEQEESSRWLAGN